MNSMYSMVVYLLRPHTILIVIVAWSMYRIWRKRDQPHPSLRPLILSLLLLAFLSTHAAAYLAFLPLEAYYPPSEARPEGAEAIVVFAAGVYPPTGRRLRAEMDEDSLHRCLHAARLYRQNSPCPVLVSGGKVDPDDPGPSFAAVLGELLVQLGVRPTDLILEERSRNTYENAVETARLLKARDVSRVALVVDAADMPRAAGCLRKQGILVLPAACHYRATNPPSSLLAFLPGPGGAAQFERAWHEWLGMLWYWLRGRM